MPSTDYLDSHIWSVTVRLYCSCGEALWMTTGWMDAAIRTAEFWGDHHGTGHGPCDPKVARRVRTRRRRNPLPMWRGM